MSSDEILILFSLSSNEGKLAKAFSTCIYTQSMDVGEDSIQVIDQFVRLCIFVYISTIVILLTCMHSYAVRQLRLAIRLKPDLLLLGLLLCLSAVARSGFNQIAEARCLKFSLFLCSYFMGARSAGSDEIALRHRLV